MSQVRTQQGSGSGGDDGGQPTARSDNKHEFGRRLHQLLLKKGMRQADLARAAGVKRDAISSYINGKALPEALNLRKIAEALGMEDQDLLPDTMRAAPDSGLVPLAIRTSASEPGRAWLTINQPVSTNVALKIAALLEQDNEPADRK